MKKLTYSIGTHAHTNIHTVEVLLTSVFSSLRKISSAHRLACQRAAEVHITRPKIMHTQHSVHHMNHTLSSNDALNGTRRAWGSLVSTHSLILGILHTHTHTHTCNIYNNDHIRSYIIHTLHIHIHVYNVHVYITNSKCTMAYMYT